MAEKSTGVTDTERMLAEFCERSFLKLWSYPNPHKDDGHELCDLLAVFDNHVFIFFDRKNELPDSSDKDPQVLWDRWRRNVIDRQVKTAHGTERYIRSERSIFVDAKKEHPFPIPFDRDGAIIHKIIVAHGAKEACERDSPKNVYGSLAITYTESNGGATAPFHVEIDKHHPVHILDSHNMPIVLGQLDTVSDFAAYLDEKVRAISNLDHLAYCGEEDLLAHYLLNYDRDSKRHFIGSKDKTFNGVMIGEGEWHDFAQSDLYKNTKREDGISYFWGDLIQRTCQNKLDDTLGGDSDIEQGKSAVYEMVKEPRFVRRSLSEKMLTAVERFPRDDGAYRQVTLIPSFQPNVAYILLQLRPPAEVKARPDFRQVRMQILQIACGAAKNRFPRLAKVIGIGIEPPRSPSDRVAEDFLLLNCASWSQEEKTYYEELNKEMRFFDTPNMQQFSGRVTQFVSPDGPPKRVKVGRNDPCPCGSGTKFKKCHGS
jgi:hypothetical protein